MYIFFVCYYIAFFATIVLFRLFLDISLARSFLSSFVFSFQIFANSTQMGRFQSNFCFASILSVSTKSPIFRFARIVNTCALSVYNCWPILVDYLTHRLLVASQCKTNAQFARDSYSSKIAFLAGNAKKITINSIRIQSWIWITSCQTLWRAHKIYTLKKKKTNKRISAATITNANKWQKPDRWLYFRNKNRFLYTQQSNMMGCDCIYERYRACTGQKQLV